MEQDTAGDGFFATFYGPARAARCAKRICEVVSGLGLAIRAGVHIGECERTAEKMSGIAVHTGARVMAQAQPGEVLVSGTAKDLVCGSGLTFVERGIHQLKGIPGDWSLFAVEQVALPATRAMTRQDFSFRSELVDSPASLKTFWEPTIDRVFWHPRAQPGRPAAVPADRY